MAIIPPTVNGSQNLPQLYSIYKVGSNTFFKIVEGRTGNLVKLYSTSKTRTLIPYKNGVKILPIDGEVLNNFYIDANLLLDNYGVIDGPDLINKLAEQGFFKIKAVGIEVWKAKTYTNTPTVVVHNGAFYILNAAIPFISNDIDLETTALKWFKFLDVDSLGLSQFINTNSLGLSQKNISFGESFIANYRNSVLDLHATYFPNSASYEVGMLKQNNTFYNTLLMFIPSALKIGSIYNPIGNPLSFTRAGKAMYINENRELVLAAVDEPRFDFSDDDAVFLNENQVDQIITKPISLFANYYWFHSSNVTIRGNDSIAVTPYYSSDFTVGVDGFTGVETVVTQTSPYIQILPSVNNLAHSFLRTNSMLKYVIVRVTFSYNIKTVNTPNNFRYLRIKGTNQLFTNTGTIFQTAYVTLNPETSVLEFELLDENYNTIFAGTNDVTKEFVRIKDIIIDTITAGFKTPSIDFLNKAFSFNSIAINESIYHDFTGIVVVIGDKYTFSLLTTSKIQVIKFGSTTIAGTDVYKIGNKLLNGFYRQDITRTFTVAATGVIRVEIHNDVIGIISFDMFLANLIKGTPQSLIYEGVEDVIVTRFEDLPIITFPTGSQNVIETVNGIEKTPSGNTTPTFKISKGLINKIIVDNNINYYSPSFGSSATNIGISQVIFNTINNSDPINNVNSGYKNFTNLTTKVKRGSTYNLSVFVDNVANFATIKVKAWIDWNQDGNFNTIDEEYYVGSRFKTFVNPLTGSTSNSPLSITIPLTAKLGTTRMRISAKHTTGSLQTPYEINFDGEVEDYSIEII